MAVCRIVCFSIVMQAFTMSAISLKGLYILNTLAPLEYNIYLTVLACLVSEFSLARYSNTAVYANNSFIDINLVGEGFEEPQITDGGALECHTDDTTCCRGIDNPPNGTGRGEWYYPNGTVVPPPGGGTGFYRTRDRMVIRLNRMGLSQGSFLADSSGVYRCEIPSANGTSITRFIELIYNGGRLANSRRTISDFTSPLSEMC